MWTDAYGALQQCTPERITFQMRSIFVWMIYQSDNVYDDTTHTHNILERRTQSKVIFDFFAFHENSTPSLCRDENNTITQ